MCFNTGYPFCSRATHYRLRTRCGGVHPLPWAEVQRHGLADADVGIFEICDAFYVHVEGHKG